MAIFYTTTIAAGQTVTADSMILQQMVLTAAAANATAKIYYTNDAGSPVAVCGIAAIANTTAIMPAISLGTGFGGWPLKGPVTVDLTGAGAQLTIKY